VPNIAKIGKTKCGKKSGKYHRGEKSDRTDKLLETRGFEKGILSGGMVPVADRSKSGVRRVVRWRRI